MRNARLGELQAGIKIDRRNFNNLRYVDDTTLMSESEKMEAVTDCLFLGSTITMDGEKQRYHSADKGPYSQGYGLPSGHVQL